MKDLNELSKYEIINLIKENKISAADLTDSGICHTFFNNENNHVL